jgi:hypothetical protein
MADVRPVPNPTQTVGINDVYEYNEIHLDSAERDGGTNNEPTFNIQPVIQSVLAIRVKSAMVPFAFYVVNDTNNTFQLQLLGVTAVPDPIPYAVPPGNYNAATLAARVQALFTGLFTVEYDDTTGKFTFTELSHLGGWGFQLIFPDTETMGIAQWLGFDRGTYSSVNTSSTAVLTSPNVAMVTGHNYLMLTSNLGSRISRNIRVNGTHSHTPNLLCKIPINQQPGMILEYDNNTENYAFDYSDGFIQQITLSLQYGEDGTLVDMNGVPWEVTLQVLTVRNTSVTEYGMGSSHRDATMGTNAKRVRMH